MELNRRLTLQKILYAALFVLVLPLLLIQWANQIDAFIFLPAVHSPIIGFCLMIAGGMMLLTGTINLYIYGKGLPMSPYPPTQYVTRGIYRYIPHPIYTGASSLVIGISIYAASASGLWLISPLFILAGVALVMGLERIDLNKRYPDVDSKPLISLPLNSNNPATLWDKLSAYLLVLIPWLCMYHLFLLLGAPEKAINSLLPFGSNLPVAGFSEPFYILAFPLVILAPLFANTQSSIRNFMISGLLASAIGFFVMIIFPLVTPDRAFERLPMWDNSMWAESIGLLQTTDVSFTAFPSFHIIWSWIAISIYVDRFHSLRYFFYTLAILISVGCITVGRYSIVDIFSGFAVYGFAQYRATIWRFIQGSSESIANSWKEWDLGRIRFLNHGLYGGLATFTGIFMVGALIGKQYLPAIIVVAVMAMIFAAIWAQFLEGSKKLLRPLGFYGGVLGIIFGCLLVKWIFKLDFFLIWAPFAVAAPWIQGIGRLRCLVQGCCHGSVTTSNRGIRYFHYRSRVARLSDLKGKYLYPTPVYSILANIVSGTLLLKLWCVHASLPLIVGLSFILNGLSRFVEESYRGEPQTPIIKGMRVYQWLALGGVIIGAVLSTIPYEVHHQSIQISMETVLVAAGCGLLAIFLTGIDFPGSSKRFSRLV